MKEIKYIVKNKSTADSWQHLLQWLQLLVHALTRIKKKWVGDVYRNPLFLNSTKSKQVLQFSINNYTKTKKMKLQQILIKWAMILLMVTGGTMAMAQGPYPNTGNDTVCLNATEPYGVVLNAGSTYAWTVTPLAGGNGTITAGATPNLITVNWTNVGTATLRVVETSADGCPGDPVTIIVLINPLPTVTVNSSTVCSGTAATITATPGVPGTYNYAWTVPGGATNPGNVASFISTTAGTYSVVITDAATNCGSASASGTVVVNPSPTLVITDPSAVCAPGTVDLTAPSVTAGSTAGITLTYWTDAAATIPYPTPATAAAGTYYIKGTTALGCFDIKPVVASVTATPTVVINNPAAVCSPNTVDLTAPAITAGSTAGLTYTYWTDAAGTIPYPTPTAATAGTYYIKGSANGGCSDIKPVTVVVNPLPAPVVTGLSPVCVGNSTTYSTPNVAGHTYNWVVTGGTISAGQGTNQVTVLWNTAGTGIVTVTQTITATGCSAPASLNVTVNPKPVTTPITHN